MKGRDERCIVAGSENEAQDGNWELGRITKPDDGLLSNCNRAKILIELCILTSIAENLCVFECMCVLIPVGMEGWACTDVAFPLVQCTYIGPTEHTHYLLLYFKQRPH